jgi:hypothetical protein
VKDRHFGFCVKANGDDQNQGVVQLDAQVLMHHNRYSLTPLPSL